MMLELAALIGQYGLLIIFALVLLEQLGLPLPGLPALVVAGALAAGGGLSLPALFGAAVLACLIGDAAWYAAGSRYGNRVLATLCRVSLSPDICVNQAQANFDRWGMGLLVVAKFIPGLSTVVPPLAGATRVGWSAFLLFDGIGTVLWAATGLGAGYLMHAQIEELLAQAERLGSGVLILVATLVLGYIATKWLERRRLQAMLRLARIEVDELHALVSSGSRPMIVDLRPPMARALEPRTIPGAVPSELRAISQDFGSPQTPDQDIIIFCTCPNEAGAAQAARLLMERGYARVRTLRGGLDAWIAAGHDMQMLAASAA
ncbi:MAG: DedA family protein/thiosulfate sulfurtransferase GlpE [Sulfuritalea sp.]|nr:DedA family protein/thiosulfate sulfurtransferase GlpE [Sulfuritalea sp.]